MNQGGICAVTLELPRFGCVPLCVCGPRVEGTHKALCDWAYVGEHVLGTGALPQCPNMIEV